MATTRTPKLAVEMTQLYQDRISMSHSRCTADCGPVRHTWYGDTEHSSNDSLLGDEALPLPYPWDCQSSIETLCGKHGGFNVGDCRRHDVEYGGSSQTLSKTIGRSPEDVQGGGIHPNPSHRRRYQRIILPG